MMKTRDKLRNMVSEIERYNAVSGESWFTELRARAMNAVNGLESECDEVFPDVLSAVRFVREVQQVAAERAASASR